MTKSTPATRTDAAIQARKVNTHNLLEHVRAIVRQMKREHALITPTTVASRAEVSRTFLYQNSDARQLIDAAMARAATQKADDQSARAAAIEQSWRERALNAEAGLADANREIELQRKTIGELLGRIRDLEADLPEDGVQRVLAENTNLKRRVRELEQQVQTAEERLNAARANNRFLDGRIAQLEAQLIASDPAHRRSPAQPNTRPNRTPLHSVHDPAETPIADAETRSHPC